MRFATQLAWIPPRLGLRNRAMAPGPVAHAVAWLGREELLAHVGWYGCLPLVSTIARSVPDARDVLSDPPGRALAAAIKFTRRQ